MYSAPSTQSKCLKTMRQKKSKPQGRVPAATACSSLSFNPCLLSQRDSRPCAPRGTAAMSAQGVVCTPYLAVAQVLRKPQLYKSLQVLLRFSEWPYNEAYSHSANTNHPKNKMQRTQGRELPGREPEPPPAAPEVDRSPHAFTPPQQPGQLCSDTSSQNPLQ